MNMRHSLISLGAAIAAAPVARSIHSLTMDNALGVIGLERRRSKFLERLALVGAGAMVGAGTALLFAPSSGRETRQKIKEGAENLANEAAELGNRVIEDAKDASERALGKAHSPGGNDAAAHRGATY